MTVIILVWGKQLKAYITKTLSCDVHKRNYPNFPAVSGFFHSAVKEQRIKPCKSLAYLGISSHIN